jgi:hypothetical protein
MARSSGGFEPLLRASYPKRGQPTKPPPGLNSRWQFTRLVGSTQEPSKQGSYVPFELRVIPPFTFHSCTSSSAAAVLPRKEEGIDVGAIDAAVLIDIG